MPKHAIEHFAPVKTYSSKQTDAQRILMLGCMFDGGLLPSP